VWICKPTDLSRGRKIFLIRNISELRYDHSTIIQRVRTERALSWHSSYSRLLWYHMHAWVFCPPFAVHCRPTHRGRVQVGFASVCPGDVLPPTGACVPVRALPSGLCAVLVMHMRDTLLAWGWHCCLDFACGRRKHSCTRRAWCGLGQKSTPPTPTCRTCTPISPTRTPAPHTHTSEHTKLNWKRETLCMLVCLAARSTSFRIPTPMTRT